MRQKKRVKFLFSSLIFVFLMIFVIFGVSPSAVIRIPNTFISISPIIIFFLLLFLSACSIGMLVVGNTKRSLLLAVFVAFFFLLRFIELRHPLFLILLAALFFIADTFVRQSTTIKKLH